jgi:hypothetical protein
MAISVPRFERLDTISPFTNTYFNQALQSVAARTYDRKYPPLKAREFIPKSSDVHTGAELYRYYTFSKTGQARIVKSYASSSPPLGLNVAAIDQQIQSLQVAFEYTIQDMRNMSLAAQNGQPANLDAQRAAAAHYFIEKAIDDIAQLGNSANGLSGFLNNSAVPIYSGTLNGSWHTLNLPTDSGKIIADITNVVSSIVSNSSQVEYPDTLLLPITEYNIIANNLVNTAASKTILEHILDASPYIKQIDQWFPLKTAGAGSVTRMVAYRKDPEVVELVIPQEFEMLAPQEMNLAYVVNCHARIGGVVVRYPLAMTYADGV